MNHIYRRVLADGPLARPPARVLALLAWLALIAAHILARSEIRRDLKGSPHSFMSALHVSQYGATLFFL